MAFCSPRRLLSFLSQAFPEIDLGPGGIVGTTEAFIRFCADSEKVEKLAAALWKIDYEHENKMRPYCQPLKLIDTERDAAEVDLIKELRGITHRRGGQS